MTECAFTEQFRKYLRDELVPATGCTEPIAIAYASAKAVELLGQRPLWLDIRCSSNIVKNTMGVLIPRSDGRHGVKPAAVLGALWGKASDELEVLEHVKDVDFSLLDELTEGDFCKCSVADTKEKLYISVTAIGDGHKARAVIARKHTNFALLMRDQEVLLNNPPENYSDEVGEEWTVENIFEYAQTEDEEILKDLLLPQLQMNSALAEEGLINDYGARVGKTLLKSSQSLNSRACAKAAAACDARMGGCTMPVIINSGSGDQGITVSVPVGVYAEELGTPMGKTLRALAISNLIAMQQKRNIGSLSAFCGAVCAATGAAAGITYLRGGDKTAISQTIINSLGTVSGIICDGAKASCAAKVAAALQASILASDIAVSGCGFHSGEGIIRDTADETIRAVGQLGRKGMEQTDKIIAGIMMSKD